MRTIQEAYSKEEIENAIDLLSDLELETKENYQWIMDLLQERLKPHC